MPLTPTRVLKTFRHGVSMDGVDDYVIIPDSDSLHVWGALTWMFWVNPIFNPRDYLFQVITSKWDGDFTHEILACGMTSWNTFYAIHRNTNGDRIYVETGKTYRSGEWCFVAVRCDLNELRIFVNMESWAVPYVGTPYPNAGPLVLGQRGDYLFWGQSAVSNLYVYNYAMSYDEIEWNYRHYDDPILNGLVLRLHADPNYVSDIDNDGRLEWLDLSGRGNHGELYGSQLVEFFGEPSRLLSPTRVLEPVR